MTINTKVCYIIKEIYTIFLGGKHMQLRKQKVLGQVEDYTENNNLTDHDYGISATTIAYTMDMDRTNISRDLNLLHQEGKLIKIHGRPTLYIAKENLFNRYPKSNFPSTIAKGHTLSEYVENDTSNVNNYTSSKLTELIGKNPNESMYEPIAKAKAAMYYPPYGLNTLVVGDEGTEKTNFCKMMFTYGKELGRFPSQSKPIVVECYAFHSSPIKDIEIMFFGEYEDTHYRKGLIDKAKYGLMIISRYDLLPAEIQTKLCTAIHEQSYHPYNAAIRNVECKTQFIATATQKSFMEKAEILRCFPTTITLPSLEERTIEELILLSLTSFQQEAYSIKHNIRITKDVLTCFAISHYYGNMPHLQAEIKQSCANAYERFQETKAIYVDVQITDLSTTVRRNINNFNERYDKVKTVVNIFPKNYFYFSSIKENEDIQMLLALKEELNTEIKITYAEDSNQLSNECIHDINECLNISLNTIQSILLKDTYDLIYPILSDQPIATNDNLLYGIINKIASFISSSNEYDNTNYILEKAKLDSNYTLCQRIQTESTVKLNHYFSQYEIDYITTYLKLANQCCEEKHIQLIVATNNARSVEYVNYIVAHGYDIRFKVLEFDMHASLKEVHQKIEETIYMKENDKGVLILSDIVNIEVLFHKLNDTHASRIKIIPKLNLSLLLSVIKQIKTIGTTVDSIVQEEENISSKNTSAYQQSDIYVKQLLDQINDYILSDSLIFLNTKKSSPIMYRILQSILSDLNVKYSDTLLIKFIFHSSFALERCIQHETFSYPKVKSFINKNHKTYNIIQNRFSLLEEVYGCSFPPTELAFITEIFVY